LVSDSARRQRGTERSAWRAAIDARSTDEGASEADTAMAIPADGLVPAPRIAWSASPTETT